MFFAEAVRSKLASRLRPWLADEPEMELKLGFMRSNWSAKNLVFDSSALDPLIEESTRLVFKQVKVGELSVRISPWSSPSLVVEVRGVYVTLAPREPRNEGHSILKDSTARKKKDLIDSIDPEGALLHESIERLSVVASSRNWIKAVFSDIFLRCCQIRLEDIHLQLQLIDESHACLLKVKNFLLEPQLLDYSYFFRGLVSALLPFGKNSILAISCSCLEFELKEKNNINCMTSLMGLSAFVRLNNLRPLGYGIQVPRVDCNFSPRDIPVLLVILDAFFSNEFGCVRNGRELWKIAVQKINLSTLNTRFSLYRLVNIVVLWLRYLHAYESLLLLVGYSADKILKENVVRVSSDRLLLSSVKYQWNLVYELEEKLPAEAVVQARRIARYRASLNSCTSDLKSPVGLLTTSLWKFLGVFSLVLKVIRFILQSFSRFFFTLWSSLSLHKGIDRSSSVLPSFGFNDSGSHLQLSLNLGELRITLFPAISDHAPINGKAEPDAKLPPLSFPSFCLIIKSLCLICDTDSIEKSLFMAFGELKLRLSSSLGVPLMESTLGVNRLENGNDSKDVLWSDPALLFHPSERYVIGSINSVDSVPVTVLENYIGDMWSQWKKISRKYEEMNVQHIVQPFALCELKSFLIDPYLCRGSYGLLKCSLTLGKLNFDLDHSSITSAALLFRQLQHCRHWTVGIGRQVLSCSSIVIEEKTEITLKDKLELYTSRMKSTMLNMIPDKNIQVGALIAGPNIRISLRRERLLGATGQTAIPVIAQGKNDYCFAIDLGKIEFAVWPASKAGLVALTGESRFNEAAAEYLWLKEPRIVGFSKALANETFISQGRIALDAWLKFNSLCVFVDDLETNQQSHVAGPMSMTIQSSACRDYLHSLSATANALSMTLIGVTTGTIVLSYMDELWTFLQAFEGTFSAASSIFLKFDYVGDVCSQDLRKLMTLAKKDTRNKVASGSTDKTMIIKSAHILVDATLELESVGIILNDSRKNHITSSSMKSGSASSSTTHYLGTPRTYKGTTISDMIDFPDFGIGVFVQKSCIQTSWEGWPMEVLIDISGIQSVVFKHQSLMGVGSDILEIKDLLYQSSNHLYEFSLSRCIFSICVGSHFDALPSANAQVAADGSVSRNCSTSFAVEGPHFAIFDNGSSAESHGPNHRLGRGHMLPSSVPGTASAFWILVNIDLGEVIIAEPCMKNLLSGAHQPNKLQLSISVGGEPHTISCKMQGGYVFLETSALGVFIHYFQAYFLLITNLLSLVFNESGNPSRKPGTSMVSEEGLARPINHSSVENVRDTLSSASYSAFLETKLKFLESLTIDLSQAFLTLAVSDGSGGAQRLNVEVDINLKLMNSGRKLLFDLCRLTIYSDHLHKSMVFRETTSPMPHFRSDKSIDLSSHIRSGNRTLPSQRTESIIPGIDDAHCTHSPDFQKEIMVESGVSEVSPNRDSYILKHVTASITIEKMRLGCELGFLMIKSDWVGNGSISGLELTITLSEIQMLSALVAPLSGSFGVKASDSLKQSFRSRNQGWTNNTDHTMSDGAIVAIQDLHQHMYFAVEAVEEKFCIVGALHYSLVGEGALFRVRHHKRWGSRVSLFSLISLYAKNDEGKPLCLNFHPGSGFVEISSTDDKAWALWQTFPYKPDSYVDDNDVESYNVSARNAFHLVNEKNKCAVAFVDGLPEFVKKPGNPFKAKVFNEFPLMHDIGRMEVSNAYGNCDASVHGGLSCVDKEKSGVGDVPHVNITIDKVVLTILHDVSDANDKFPLVRGCVDNIHIIGQMLSSKFRVISSFIIAIYYFDAQKNFWKEIISPIDSCLFFRSRFTPQDSLNVHQGVPVHFYFRMRQVDMFLTELSWDILLFLAGNLNIAGPYSVRSSMIFANCCKLVNHSGLTLLCHFADHQDAVIAGKQSASIFLRRAALAEQLPEDENLVSVRLAELGIFSTFPIHVSLSKACVFAWRTRVESQQDSRSFPGPFIVVEVSKKTEEGLSLIVSPMLRIHNESGFSMELRFRRPQESEKESASVLLRTGDTIDDSMAVFDALDLSGGIKRALMSITLGNFLLSVRPEITEYIENNGEPISIDWSEDLKGGKAIRVAGIFDKLNYRVRKAFGVESIKSFFSTIHCSLIAEGQQVSNLHFLIHSIGRDVPLMQPLNMGDIAESKSSPVAFQVQKEIFLLPTVQVYNLLRSEILVLLTENHPDLCTTGCNNNIGKQAIIPCGSSAYLYANPAMIYFTVTLTEFSSKCKPVNSGDWIKKLNKQKHEVHYLDTELDFCGGKYFASLRLSRADRGILEATVFTSYTLQNDTELPLFCFSSNQKPLSWEETAKYDSNLPPELGCLLPPKSIRSWFLKCNEVHLKWLEKKTSEPALDLDILSGFTELCLEAQDEAGVNRIAKVGVSVQPCIHKESLPSRAVRIVPRYVISNESKESIIVRQCYLEDELDGITSIEGKQKVALLVQNNTSKRRETSFFDSMLRKHRNMNEDSLIFIQFCFKEIGYSWSGPICVASLGRFFLKFKGTSVIPANPSNSTATKENSTKFAIVHVADESSSLVLHFHLPPNFPLPYRIENSLQGASIMYYQKNSMESDILESGSSAGYVWDDLNLPHKLIVQIADMHLSREINIDKVCTWKPFFKMRHNKGLVLLPPLDQRPGVSRTYDESRRLEALKVGYEVYADGLSRVLRICELADSYKEENMLQPCANIQFRVTYFAVHILENTKQEVDASDLPIYSTVVVARLANVILDSLITDQYKYYCARVQSLLTTQSLNVDEKWHGAPFASMVRRSQLHDSGLNENVLHVVFILHSTGSNVKQVKYSSIVIQPIDVKVDEETLMRLVPFWRTYLGDSKTSSQQFYFKHFEIHPIKIIASFLPGSPNLSYSSAQETLRSLLHSVIKVPTINNMIVELNGVHLTHALVTFRELVIKCAQHYSWYVMRAVYIAKGSPLLPPAFASIFDDTASSSLDVFFDPSDGSINLPGVTLGMFKVISKCIDSKGFSGTKRYFGDLGKTMKRAGTNALFACITEISDNVLKGAETNGFNGMVNGFHQGILKLAMEPSLLGAAVMEGGPDRKIKLDHSPGVDELYIEGYLQAMLDVTYKQEYLRVRVIDNQVILKNLPPNSSLINEIVENVKSFLMSKGLLKGESSTASRPLRHLRGESDWKIGPTVLTLCEHLFVSFAIRMLRKQAGRYVDGIRWKGKTGDEGKGEASSKGSLQKFNRKWAIGKFVFSGMVAYIDGRLCRHVPHPIARRIVSGFLLSFLDKKDGE